MKNIIFGLFFSLVVSFGSSIQAATMDNNSVSAFADKDKEKKKKKKSCESSTSSTEKKGCCASKDASKTSSAEKVQ